MSSAPSGISAMPWPPAMASRTCISRSTTPAGRSIGFVANAQLQGPVHPVVGRQSLVRASCDLSVPRCGWELPMNQRVHAHLRVGRELTASRCPTATKPNGHAEYFAAAPQAMKAWEFSRQSGNRSTCRQWLCVDARVRAPIGFTREAMIEPLPRTATGGSSGHLRPVASGWPSRPAGPSPCRGACAPRRIVVLQRGPVPRYLGRNDVWCALSSTCRRPPSRQSPQQMLLDPQQGGSAPASDRRPTVSHLQAGPSVRLVPIGEVPHDIVYSSGPAWSRTPR